MDNDNDENEGNSDDDDDYATATNTKHGSEFFQASISKMAVAGLVPYKLSFLVTTFSGT